MTTTVNVVRKQDMHFVCQFMDQKEGKEMMIGQMFQFPKTQRSYVTKDYLNKRKIKHATIRQAETQYKAKNATQNKQKP